eukprot:gene13093-15462_t
MDNQTQPWFGPCTHFVSHAWLIRFSTLYGALVAYDAESATNVEHMNMSSLNNNNFFYVDIFLINQHVPPWEEVPKRGPDEVLKPPIDQSKRTVLVLAPWHKPVSLSRVWCLYEIITTIQCNAQLDVCLHPGDRGKFVNTLVSNFSRIKRIFEDIACENANASYPEDKDMIFEMIQESIGFDSLNSSVVRRLQEWLLQMVKHEIAMQKNGENHVEDTDDEELAHLIFAYAELARMHNQYDEALGEGRRALKLLEGRLGEGHTETRPLIEFLSSVYKEMERGAEADSLQIKLVADSHEAMPAEKILGYQKQLAQNMPAEDRILMMKSLCREQAKLYGGTHPIVQAAKFSVALLVCECKLPPAMDLKVLLYPSKNGSTDIEAPSNTDELHSVVTKQDSLVRKIVPMLSTARWENFWAYGQPPDVNNGIRVSYIDPPLDLEETSEQIELLSGLLNETAKRGQCGESDDAHVVHTLLARLKPFIADLYLYHLEWKAKLSYLESGNLEEATRQLKEFSQLVPLADFFEPRTLKTLSSNGLGLRAFLQVEIVYLFEPCTLFSWYKRLYTHTLVNVWKRLEEHNVTVVGDVRTPPSKVFMRDAMKEQRRPIFFLNHQGNAIIMSMSLGFSYLFTPVENLFQAMFLCYVHYGPFHYCFWRKPVKRENNDADDFNTDIFIWNWGTSDRPEM